MTALWKNVRRLIIPACFLACTALCWGAASSTSRKIGFTDTNDPVVFDLNGDGAQEILLSGPNGHVAVYDSKSLRPVWDQPVSKRSVSAPVVGDFNGSGEFVLAVGSTDGVIYFIHAGNGETMASVSCPSGAAVSIAPSVVPASPVTENRDGLAVVDDEGAIHLVSLDASRKPRIHFTIKNNTAAVDTNSNKRQVQIGSLRRSPTCADVNGDGIPEIIVGSVTGVIVVIPTNKPDGALLWQGHQGMQITTGISCGELLTPGKPNIVFGTDNGDMIALSVTGANGPLQENARSRLLGKANGHLLLTKVDKDDYFDVIGASDSTVASFDGAAQMSIFGTQPFVSPAPPINVPSFVRGADGKPLVVVVDRDLDVYTVDATLPPGTPPHVKAPSRITGFAPAGDITGSGKCELVFVETGTSKLYRMTLEPAVEAGSVTSVYGADFSRSGRLNDASKARLAQMQKKAAAVFDAKISEAEKLFDDGKRKEAVDAAAVAATMRPADVRLEKLLKRIRFRANLLRNGALVILIGGVAAGAVYFLRQKNRKKQGLKLAEQFAEQGDYEAAIARFRQLQIEDPANTVIALGLANAYISSGEVPPDATDALEKARKFIPDNPDVTIALAKAYAGKGEETDAALETYLVALATMPAERGRIAYHAANMMRRRGDNDQAIKYYKLAMKEGFAEPEVVQQLAEAFLDTRQYNEKALPVYEAAAAHRKDVRLLEALCRSFSAARRSDERACAAAEALLQMNPDSLIGLRLRAKCDLQAGQPKRAAELAMKGRKLSPDDAENLAILTHALISLERTDGDALTVYREAFRLWPDQKPLLRMLAISLTANHANDDESFSLMKRACSEGVSDEDFIFGMAAAAEERKEVGTVVDCLAKLVRSGRATGEIYERLADAYASEDDVSDEAEVAYSEALKSNPEHLEWLRNLGLIYARRNRTDAQALLVLERLFSKETTNIVTGKHLVRTYIDNQRYDDAIKHVRWLLQHHKDDADLQKLFAQASLHGNKIEEAIKQYEQIYRDHPKDEEATVNLAIAYAQKQRADADAATVYEKALAIRPAETGVRVAFAKHHAAAGRIARGVEELRQAAADNPKSETRVRDEVRALIAQFPDRTDLRWFLSNLLIDSNNLRDAVEQLQSIFEADPSQARNVLQAYDKILEKDPANAAAGLKKGTILKLQGRFEEARPLLEKSYAQNAANAEAAAELEGLYDHLLEENDEVEVRFALAKLNYLQGDYDKAIGHFQKTSQDFRYENESIKMLGLCFVGKGMLEFALQEFKKLVVDDEVKEILYDLAQRYEAKNDLVGAKQVYRQLFAADINYRDVKTKFEVLAGSTSDPMTLEKTALMTQLSEKARRRYELLEEIGRGAMGIVYRAKDNELDEVVALKILPDNLSQNPEAVQRFKAEARSARRLSHPNIVRIHDIGEEMGRKYISMEFVKGSDLKKHLRSRGKLEPREIAHVMAQVASALDYAHTMQIVHRDIKPANIMVADNFQVKVSDFGIAKMLEITSETMAGAIIGTPLYMSPEQIQGESVDNRADIYSLGIMMYELANGRPPFTEGDLAYQHIKVPPRPLADVPPALNDIIMKCLAKDKDQRWATAGEIWRTLEQSGLLN